MTPSSSRHRDNPVIGVLRCKCGTLMKVRRRAFGYPGKCKSCGRILYAYREFIEPRPRKGELHALRDSPVPATGQSAPGLPAEDVSDDAWADESEPSSPPVVISSTQDTPNDAFFETEWADAEEDGHGEEAPARDPVPAVDAAPSDTSAPAAAPADAEASDADAWTDVEAEADAQDAVSTDSHEAMGPGVEIPLSPDVYGGFPAIRGAPPKSPDAQGDRNWDDSTFDVPLGPDEDEEPPAETENDERTEDSRTFDESDADADVREPVEAATSADVDAGASESPDTVWDGIAPGAPAEPLPVETPVEENGASATAWDGVAPGTGSPEAPAPELPAMPAPAAPATPEAEPAPWDSVQRDVFPPRAAKAASASPGSPDTRWDAIAPTSPPTASPLPPAPDGGTEWDDVAPVSDPPVPVRANAATPPVVPAVSPPEAPRPARSSQKSWGSSDSWLHGDSGATPRIKTGNAGTLPPSVLAVLRPGKYRPPWAIMPLALVSLSVYYYVWVYRVCCELRDHLVRRRPTSPALMVGLHFIPGFVLFWPPYVVYRMAADLNAIHALEARAPALAAGGLAAMAASGTLLVCVGALVAVQAPLPALAGLVLGLSLWGGCLGLLQSALNAHWALHVR